MKIEKEILHFKLFCNHKTIGYILEYKDAEGKNLFDIKDNTIHGIQIALNESLNDNEVSLISYKVFEDSYNGIINMNIFSPFVSLKLNHENKFLVNLKHDFHPSSTFLNKLKDSIREHYRIKKNLKYEMPIL
jgi:hypothetical protein